MEVVVLGAGVTGVTTAYFLAAEGHDVTIVDSENSVALGTSGANAGFVAPNDSFAWAAPSAPLELLKSIFKQDTGLSIRPQRDTAMYAWCLAFLAQCTKRRNIANSIVQLKIALYSQIVQLELTKSLSLQFEQRQSGSFYLFRAQEELNRAYVHRQFFEDFGLNQRVLAMEEVAEIEPALGRLRTLFAGAIFGVTDGSGDCAAFTRQLAERAVATGRLKFAGGQDVLGLISADGRVEGVQLRDHVLRAETYVLCLGTGSARVAATLGLKLPIYPVKGFAATVPVHEGAQIPERPGVDQTALVAWSSMGDRLRLCSGAQISGYDTSWSEADRLRILRLGEALFGDSLDYDKADFRAGLRPMTPAGPPIVGRSRFPNLFLNTGHGHLGWTMASGTARALVDLMMGRRYEASCITTDSA